MVTGLWRIWIPGSETTASAYFAVSLFRCASIVLTRFASLGALAFLLEILLEPVINFVPVFAKG